MLWQRWDAERVIRERTSGVRARVSDAHRFLYRDGSALLGQDPSSAPVQDLLARWKAIVQAEAGDDHELTTEMIEGFKTRHQWPSGLVRSVAASYELDAATWSAVADLIEAANERSDARDGRTRS